MVIKKEIFFILTLKRDREHFIGLKK